MKPLGVLDRYILRQWFGTFILSALGIPAVATLIALSDRIRTLTGRGISLQNILLGQLYLYPYQVSLLLPAAVLFATVFTLNAFGRRSELTAAKAGGVSFLRLVTPMLLMATLMVPVNFAIQEVAAVSSTRQRELHGDKAKASNQVKSNATFIDENGWVYGAMEARKEVEIDGKRYAGRLYGVTLESPRGVEPRRVLIADSALWSPSRGRWTLHGGSTTYLTDSAIALRIVRFRTLESRELHSPPSSLVDEQKKAEEMRYQEFVTYMDNLRRAAAAPGELQVDLYLKLALPVACLVVALFGAPLAVTNPRAGAALGLAMALGTTLVYLTGTQIMKAVGGKDLIAPELAAWSMNILFGVLALALISRVRS